MSLSVSNVLLSASVRDIDAVFAVFAVPVSWLIETGVEKSSSIVHMLFWVVGVDDGANVTGVSSAAFALVLVDGELGDISTEALEVLRMNDGV